MFSKIFSFAIKLIVAGGIIILLVPSLRGDFFDALHLSGTFNRLEKFKVSFEDKKENVEERIHLPEPLTVLKDKSTQQNGVQLVVSNIFDETNKRRVAEGLPALSYNSMLAEAALYKAEDMFKNQYFEHNSPAGKTPKDFVEKTGYEYLTIGENLALGIFDNEADLVDAWMNSPGHRANILGSQFSEIGISAKKGLYKGEEVWMSVQEFGKPASVCPAPSKQSKQTIESKSAKVDEMRADLIKLKDQIEVMDQKRSEYKQLVDSYNSLVSVYNNLVNELEKASKQYNLKVEEYNTCLEKEI